MSICHQEVLRFQPNKVDDKTRQIIMTTTTKALVITADNSVTTWDCVDNNGSNKPFVFYPNGDIPISDAAWNHNGQVLATCSALSTEEQMHNNIVLTAAQTGSRLDSLQHDEKWNQHRKVPAGAINSLAFGGKSRYLCVGDESGAVCLWDLKKRLRVREFFHDNHPSRQVSLDPTDTYILSLSPRLFSWYKLREGSLLGTVSPPHGPAGNNSLYTRYNISTIETNQTAIGTTDGTIHIYDIANLASSSSHSTMTKPLLSFGRRNSYISEVAFSTINPKLLLACDQDGIVTLYDKNSGEWLQNIDALNHSIMAMNMHTDGYSLAVGTETGQVLIYDIRHQTTSPIASMYVPGPVTSLQFAPPPKQSSSSTSSSSSKAGAGRQQQQPQQIHSLTPQSSIDEKENNESSGTVIKQSHQSAYTAPPPPYSNTRGDPQPKNGTTSNKATSPPKQQQKQHQPQSSSTSSNNIPKMHVPTLGEIQSARNNLNSSPLSSTLMQQQQNHPEGGGGYHHHQGRSTQQQQQQGQQSSSSTSNNKPPLPRGQEQPSRLDGNKNINQSSQQQPSNNNLIGQQQQHNNLPPVNNSGSNNCNMQFSSEAGTINLEEVRDLVRDEVENLKDDVEEAIRNLHMDMIAQFHQQSQELKNIVQVQMATIGKLTEENEVLRERLGISREEEQDPGEGNARG